tara:strand:+ start:271 stop:537 length:267 start_codon:yes stop_codon:yes gene_type:complete
MEYLPFTPALRPGRDQPCPALAVRVHDRNNQQVLDPADRQAPGLSAEISRGQGEALAFEDAYCQVKAETMLAPVGVILCRIPFEFHGL